MLEVHLQSKVKRISILLFGTHSFPLEAFIAIDLEHLSCAKYVAYQLFILWNKTVWKGKTKQKKNLK